MSKLKSRFLRHAQRGATMVSVSLLSISLVSASLLLLKQANRSATESGVVVARERALLAAQGAAELAIAYYRARGSDQPELIDDALRGFHPASDPKTCADIKRDCVPGNAQMPDVPTTGMRAEVLTGRTDCAGRVCMRPGAVSMLPDSTNGGIDIPWARVPLSTIVAGGDPQAMVTVWVRNNAADALTESGSGASGSWVIDEDSQIVVTAMAEVFGTVVTVEQEVALVTSGGNAIWQMAPPDLGYGGGHNNDSVAVEVCSDGATVATSAP